MAGEAVAHAAEVAHGTVDLVPVVALLAAGVIAVPIFKRIGLGSVLGYLAAGLLLGPSGIGLISDPSSVLHLAELGVVMFLFIIGLEMEPSRLWALRKQIFGLGVIQVVSCGALLTLVGVALGFAPAVAFIFGMGFVLTSTAIVMQILGERGELSSEGGQKIVSVLLLEDLAIVPLLAVVALLAPAAEDQSIFTRVIGFAGALGAILLLIVLGRRVMNPFFALLASAKVREVMTAAALLVVLGAALLFQVSGLSMAMGAFLAGVLLSTSTFRHQLEADVEPFRGLLLGLFFLAVGMSLDLHTVAQSWQVIAISVVAFMLVKGVAIYVIARLLRSDHGEALERAVLMGQGGEFAFVLYTTAVSAGIIDGPTNAIFTATVIISMVLTPFALIVMRRFMPKRVESMDGVEEADGLTGRVLIIGFGRFGQIASQPLLALRHSVSIIDNDTDMIRAAAQIGFKVYYGDGTRLDILRAAGAHTADLILICTDDRAQTTRIAELLRDEFPLARVMARAFDRSHGIELLQTGVEFQVRETFESAVLFGGTAISMLGSSEDETAEVLEGVRDRDRQRFELQLGGEDWRNLSRLLISNAQEQARESGINISEDSAEAAVARSAPATSP
ncbi:potassium transporter [Devosia soli]|uniref:Potassium transporter n=1 Tax=Devosia soli TaxID=361041 RepID=A0A0F5LCE5_9HYPH|nr:monovalent cation:proton antiporter-2 (CPA2) family protein [Devosia soli]KKB80036.1 potassium transporter [Devosia soli]